MEKFFKGKMLFVKHRCSSFGDVINPSNPSSLNSFILAAMSSYFDSINVDWFKINFISRHSSKESYVECLIKGKKLTSKEFFKISQVLILDILPCNHRISSSSEVTSILSGHRRNLIKYIRNHFFITFYIPLLKKEV